MDVLLLLLVVVAAVLALGVVLVVRRTRTRSATSTAPSAGLAETTIGLGDRISRVLSRRPDERIERLEEALLAADIGFETSHRIAKVAEQAGASERDELRRIIQRELMAVFAEKDRSLKLSGKPAVIVMVGVNGTGKTTTVAKLGHRLREQGHEPLLGAADTFRAAADTQLQTWADRLEMELVSGSPRSDPAAVAFDALQAARARGKDVVIVDTAGRLHSHQNLMAELEKIIRVLDREQSVGEVLLVIDGTVGQNGLAQAREFASAVEVSGIVLTKLDGTAKGGIVVAAEESYDIPVKFVGVGEEVGDLEPFDPHIFVDALLEGV